MKKKKYFPKPEFSERIKKLMPDSDSFFSSVEKPADNSIRCNTLKISPSKLKQRLEKKSWKISQPYESYPEIMIIKSNLAPGQLGKSIEHLLGYYYIQETASMLPPLALKPEPEDIVLDLAAAPGSKTTQTAALMENKGTIIANDTDIRRTKILISNLEKSGISNTIVTRHDGVILCEKLKKHGFQFDKIFLDLPCSGEGNIKSNPATYLMWNLKMIDKLSRLQKKLAASAIPLLKKQGTLVYSTCTHSPEENEAVVSFLLKQFPELEIQEASLPLKSRPGITNWLSESYNPQVKKAHRIYPQDNNTEGFFLAKLRKK
jgi:NOL1/NOP2/sun family putative RNA methylase